MPYVVQISKAVSSLRAKRPNLDLFIVIGYINFSYYLKTLRLVHSLEEYEYRRALMVEFLELDFLL